LNPASVKGTGLHTGAAVTAKLAPAEPGAGIVFRRTDLGGAEIPARLDRVADTDRRTSLGAGEAVVHTAEHLLAAVAAHGIDDLTIELDGPELPIGDGSAQAYSQALERSGITETGGEANRFRQPAPLTVQEGDAVYHVTPHEGLRLTVTIEWDHPLIGTQSGCYDVSPKSFAAELAAARTFGFERDAEELRERGLAQGAGLENTLVLTEHGVKGAELRWPDEFVRHKATDLLGDLALLGGRLDADIVALRPSHTGNVALARAIAETAKPEDTYRG
jgi:UDP-3-O-acyl N-acetylglucosamine deacetylase